MGFEKLDDGRQDKRPYLRNNEATKCFLQNLFLEIASFLSWLVVVEIVFVALVITQL
jgi:hypothetical protein